MYLRNMHCVRNITKVFVSINRQRNYKMTMSSLEVNEFIKTNVDPNCFLFFLSIAIMSFVMALVRCSLLIYKDVKHPFIC